MEDKTLILLVDDDKINLKRAQEILKQDDYTIAAALSGDQAIQFVEKKIPDLILLDINMPGLDGFETLDAIRKIPGREQIPVIFLTAQDDVDTEVKGFELGADDFVRKPFVSSIMQKRVQRSIESARLRNSLEVEVARQTKKAEERRKELERISFEVIQTLAATIDTKDPYTKGHSTRVSEYSVLLAQKLGWDKQRIEDLSIMAMLHDVGKIAVPDRLLNKPGRLEEGEFEVIKSHTVHGDTILKGVSSLESISKVARHHHERFDGRGYPDKLLGTDIEMEARIVGIADAYDAMSSDRVYRKALSKEIIREELIKGKGTQFDPDFLDAFLELFEKGELDVKSSVNDIESVQIDMSDFMNTLSQEQQSEGAIRLTHNELIKVYGYLKSRKVRDGASFRMVMITLDYAQGYDANPEHLEKAMAAMEYSIVQCLRRSDLTSRITDSQHLVVLTEVNDDYIGMIVERIFAGYYKNCLYTDIKPSYEIDEKR